MHNNSPSGTIQQDLLLFVREKWGRPLGIESEIQANTDLFEQGIVDSIGVLSLVRHIEDEFALEIEPEQLVLENFVSVGAMARLVGDLMRNSD